MSTARTSSQSASPSRRPTLTLIPRAAKAMHIPAEEEPINDPGNEDPGSLMDDAQVPLIEEDEVADESSAGA